MSSSHHPDIDSRRSYTRPSEPLWQFSREAAEERARAATKTANTSAATESASSGSAEPTTPRAQRAGKTSKPYTELVINALYDQLRSGKKSPPPTQTKPMRLKYLKRVVDRQGVVRIYYARGGKPHIRLDAPVGTPAFIEAYEAAQQAKAMQWRIAQRPCKPHRSLRDLVDLYQRSQSYARLAPLTQRVYDRVLHRLLHVEGLADCSASSLGPKRIQQLVDRHAGTPSAAADLLKKLRILFRCAIDHGWRSDDPTRGVRIGHGGDVASRWPS